jgi:uncharacterized protein
LDDTIKFLIGLQNCDLKIRDIQKRMAETPQKFQALEEGLKALEKVSQEESGRLEEQKRERRHVEQEIASFDSRIEKSQTKLSNTKSNKEYRAALKEIDDLKREKTKFEERALELMEEVESHEKRVVDNKATLERARAQFEEDKEEVAKEVEALRETLKEWENERVKLSRSVGKELLEKYDFLKGRKGGIAVSSVIHAVCQTCHLGIPAQKFNELIRGDVLLTCPHCNRIIYWGDKECFQKASGDNC